MIQMNHIKKTKIRKLLPSCIVKAMGFRVKSGVVDPGGSSSTYCVTITPGTLDLFLIATEISEHCFQKRIIP